MDETLTKCIKVLTEFFERNNVNYVFVGGISVIILGRPRMTMDLDLIVDDSQLPIPEFVKHLNDNGYSAYESDFEEFEQKMHVNVYLIESMFRIDMKGIYTKNDQRAIDMAIDSEFNGVKIKLNHPTNIVAYKLYFGSDQDYEDALAVFIRNEEMIDSNSLRDYCIDLGVEDKLNVFLKQIEDFKSKKNIK